MKDRKKSKTRRRYDEPFKRKLLELHKNGRSISSLASSFDVSENILYRWRRKAEEEELSAATGVDVEELKQLRKRVKELEEERDILKKALSIFSRQA